MTPVHDTATPTCATGGGACNDPEVTSSLEICYHDLFDEFPGEIKEAYGNGYKTAFFAGAESFEASASLLLLSLNQQC